MAVVVISRGSLTRAGQLASSVAKRLGYACLAREILLEASRQFNIPETRLVHAVTNAPSVLDRITRGRRRYLAYIRAALLERCKEDRIVYHGFAGQCLLDDVSHVLKVRVIAELEDRIQIVTERDGVSRQRALATLRHDDRERVRWSQHLHGIDIRQPEAYDMVFKVGHLSLEAAVDLICEAVCHPELATTAESQQKIEDLALAANVHAALIDITADIEVTASRGRVTIKTVDRLAELQGTAQHIENLGMAVAGVQDVRVEPGLLAQL